VQTTTVGIGKELVRGDEKRVPPQQTSGTIRHDMRIACPARLVWPYIADPDRLADWFPGMRSTQMNEGTWERRVVTNAGVEQIEEIVTIDAILMRFQYRILPNFVVRSHLATIDVVAIDEQSCLVLYATEMEPRAFALAIGGGTLDALHELKRQAEEEYRTLDKTK
jgi:uncharacterized protein YndB with AHSA1/START domain